MDLTFATWDHDRVSALHDGRLSVPGVALESVVAPTSKLFPLAVTEAKYDITEMSISSYILQLSRVAVNILHFLPLSLEHFAMQDILRAKDPELRL